MVSGLFAALLGFIRFVADVDFVVSRAQNPGWILAVLNWVLTVDIPDWLIGGLAILSALLVLCALKSPVARAESPDSGAVKQHPLRRDPAAFEWMWSVYVADIVPFRRRTPLREATRIAYEETQGQIAAKAAERFSEDGIGVHDYYARALIGRNEIPVFGKKSPSTKLTSIPLDQLGNVLYENEANDMVSVTDGRLLYTDLHIRKRDFRARLRTIKQWDRNDGDG